MRLLEAIKLLSSLIIHHPLFVIVWHPPSCVAQGGTQPLPFLLLENPFKG